jgi:hypothetical protein
LQIPQYSFSTNMLFCFCVKVSTVNKLTHQSLKKNCCILRSEVHTAVKMLMLVFWIVMPCGLVVRYQRFGGIYYLHLQVWNGGSMFLWNGGTYLQVHTVLLPRRPILLFFTLLQINEGVFYLIILAVCLWYKKYERLRKTESISSMKFASKALRPVLYIIYQTLPTFYDR